MVEDSIKNCSKKLRDSDAIVADLIKLRDELYARGSKSSCPDVFFKINSCLYRGYN